MRILPKCVLFAAITCAQLVCNTRLAAAAEEAKALATVVDSAGNPVAGAKIEVRGEETRLPDGKWEVNHTPHCVLPVVSGKDRHFTTGVADEQGGFTVSPYDKNRRANVWVLKENFAPTFAVLTPGEPPAKIVIQKGEQLSGSIKEMVNGKLEPVVGASVYLLCTPGDMKHAKDAFDEPYFLVLSEKEGGDLPLILDAKTSATGEYTFQVSEPPAGRSWFLILGKRCHDEQCLEKIVPIEFKAGHPVPVPDIVRDPAHDAEKAAPK